MKTSVPEEFQKSEWVIRPPTISDAPKIWRLVGDSGVLDLNSSYLYLLLCRDFSQTCLVADRDSHLGGFVTAYRLPNQPEVLFVWQIGVCSSARRQGLGLRMLSELVSRSGPRFPRFVETTVSPSNTASRNLFESWARRLGVPLIETEGFSESDFPTGDHESEPRLRIGPLCE